MKKFDIYSKMGCPYCDKAKALLEHKGYKYDEYLMSNSVLKEDIQARINALGVATEVRTVPQIFFKDAVGKERYIGGYDQLSKIIDEL